MLTFRRVSIASGIALAAAVWAAQSYAALPPHYDRWNEFAAIVGDASVPRKLGVQNPAERIERASDGSYRVYGGKCHVTVTLSRQMPTGPQGQLIVGSSRISVADVRGPRCE
jgi:hypothetical protein